MKIKNAKVWTGGKALEQRDIGIEGARFVDPAKLDPRTDVIDAEGLTILPGLINAHVHFCLDGSNDSVPRLISEAHLTTAYRAAAAAEDTLRAGTTTVRDVGCSGAIGIYLKKAIDAGFVRGPRMLASGPCIVMTGGHNRFIGVEVDGVEEARKAARLNLKMGADLIKVVATGGVITSGVEPEHVQLSALEMKAAVDEAHNCGKHAASHAQGEQGIANSLDAGVDTIEHGIYLTPLLIEKMLKQGSVLVPTLTPMRRILLSSGEDKLPDYAVEKMRRTSEPWLESFRKAIAAGIPIVAGTDAGTPGNPHGSVAVEVKFMVEAGMSEELALKSATSVAAEAIGLGGKIGQIREGYVADLIFIRGNPLDDIHTLDNLCGVMKDGEMIWFNPGARDGLISKGWIDPALP
ncbi:metal-dependent hydrolase family protein [Bradyrhizobium elkanii]|jgi:imidazolonepropionase-like amidohydrolase|uniref:metal-dependent hydrolase family protein n=1 Tax=Bradyrhizobium elkanii TaxID=29448 RepID=UPI0005C1BA08|nr:amidohydrolase family protein [Bradyrhizobium elkanii]KIU48720.1 amidohydrolase [Bradyrhizobium elkanii]